MNRGKWNLLGKAEDLSYDEHERGDLHVKWLANAFYRKTPLSSHDGKCRKLYGSVSAMETSLKSPSDVSQILPTLFSKR